MENHLCLEDVQPDPKAKRVTLVVKKATAAVTTIAKTLTVANDDDDDFELSPKRRKLGMRILFIYFNSFSSCSRQAAKSFDRVVS